MNAETIVFWVALALLAVWCLYLLGSATRELWRTRRRPWWREPPGGDLIPMFHVKHRGATGPKETQ